MVRIPDQHAIGQPRWGSPTSVPSYDAGAMAAPGKAKAKVGEAIAQAGKAIGGALSSLGAAAEKSNQYETATAFVDFDMKQSDAYRAAERNIAPDGGGFRESISKQYDSDAREFFKTVPDADKPKYDYMLRKRAQEYEGRAREREYDQADKFHVEDLDKRLTSVYSGIGQDLDDPNALTEAIGRGKFIIENSKLPQNRRDERMGKFLSDAEEYHILARKEKIKGILADPKTTVEEADRLNDELEKDIRLRIKPAFDAERKALPGQSNLGGQDAKSLATARPDLIGKPAHEVSKAVYQSTPGVVYAIADQTSRTFNEEGFGNKTTGAITVNGRTYEFVNGGYKRGSIPLGEYKIQRYTSGSQRAREGYQFTRDAFELSDVAGDAPATKGKRDRQGLLIHSAASGVTAGCVGIKGDFAQFKIDLMAEIKKNDGKLALNLAARPTGSDATRLSQENYSGLGAGAQARNESAAIKVAADGRIDPVSFARSARDQISNSSLNGFVPEDGEKFGVTKGTPEEWARLFAMLTKQESDMRVASVNPDGSLRRFKSTLSGEKSFGPGQFNVGEYGLKTWEDVNNPERVIQAYIKVAERFAKKKGTIQSMEAYFGSIKRSNELLQHAKYGSEVMASLGGPQQVASAAPTDAPLPGQKAQALASSKEPVRYASLGNDVPESMIEDVGAQPRTIDASNAGEELPDAPIAGYAAKNGELLSQFTPEGQIRTILDGFPPELPLSQLPEDVRGPVLGMLPKEALTERTLEDGTKVAAVDVMTVGGIKAAVAAPLKEARDAGNVQVAQADSIYTDNPRYRYLSDAQREKQLRQLQIDRRAFYQSKESAEIARIEMFGQESHDSQGRTFIERAARVLTPNQLTALRLKLDAAHAKFNFIQPIPDMPDDQLDAHVEQLRPQPTDNDVELTMKSGIYKEALAKVDAVRALRKKDIALSVQQSPEVKLAMREARKFRETLTMGTQDGQPVAQVASRERTASAMKVWENLIEARISAQERITGDSFDSDDGTISGIRVLTKKEAADLLGTDSWSLLSEEEKYTQLERAANRADETYGKYARRAVNDAVKLMTRDKYTSEMAPGLIQKMVRGEQLSAMEKQRYQTIGAMSPVQSFLMTDVPDEFTGGQMVNGTRLRGGAAAGPAGRPGISPGAMAGPNQPTMAQMAALLQDPARVTPRFDAKYGHGAAQQVISMFQKAMSGPAQQPRQAPAQRPAAAPAAPLDFGISP